MTIKMKNLFIYLSFFILSFVEIFKNIFIPRRKCVNIPNLNGKVVIITGANAGIGRETAYRLSLKGAKIIIGCRDLNRAQNAINYIKSKNPLADITYLKLDLSSLTSVRQFAAEIAEKERKIDILINNAGAIGLPESSTEDGFETTFVTNYLGHFLLTLILMDLLKKSSEARVINVSSSVYKIGQINFDNINFRNGAYNCLKIYGQTKLANILFTRELAKRLGPDSNVKTYSLHPGAINSGFALSSWTQSLLNPILNLVLLDLELGSETIVYCSTEEKLKNESGYYYDDCKRVDKLLKKAMDGMTAENLWEMSCNLVKLNKDFKL